MEITKPEGNLESTGSLEVTSGAGPDICVGTVQDEIERVFGPSDWHHDSNYSPVASTLPESCTGPLAKRDIEISRE
jgi:hypothetical protein